MMICDKWWWGNVKWEAIGINPFSPRLQIFLLVRKIYIKTVNCPDLTMGDGGSPRGGG